MEWKCSTPGIPESQFLRGDVPLTKTEVRVLALSKLCLQPDSSVLDIGCGTGSITVEAGLLAPRGRVVALDKSEEAVNLTRLNAERFGLSNVQVICGQAPEDLPDDRFDRIFIGGGSSNLPGLVEYARTHLKEGGILAADTILLESACSVLKSLEEKGFQELDCVSLNISRGERIRPGWMMKALNPIYIISGRIK